MPPEHEIAFRGSSKVSVDPAGHAHIDHFRISARLVKGKTPARKSAGVFDLKM
jgi:hypothetical protein